MAVIKIWFTVNSPSLSLHILLLNKEFQENCETYSSTAQTCNPTNLILLMSYLENAGLLSDIKGKLDQ